MTKNLTRRKFFTVAGGAVGSTFVGQDAFLRSQTMGAPSTAVGHSDVPCDGGCPPLQSLVFPEPQEVSGSGSEFVIDNQVPIVVPADASKEDLLLADMLANELGDRFALHLKIERVTNLTADRRAILMGSIENRLVRQYCTETDLMARTQSLGPEGYILRANNDIVLVAGVDDRGAFYGLQSLRQLLANEGGSLRFRGVLIRDWPDKPFRGIKLYVPGRANFAFFKRFVRDFMALYKYNTLIMEMNANMRLNSHPEVNSGWLSLIRDTDYSRRNYPPGPFHDVEQNSTHYDTADGDILEKDEVADLARWVKKYHIELIPELPSLTHSYYLLASHRELAAVPQHKWPDTYCPLNPDSYKLVFDIYDEYLDLFKPQMVHVGHDELFTPLSVSPSCEFADIGELYGRDIQEIYAHLAARGIKIALWGDMLLQSVRGDGPQKNVAKDGWVYHTAGGMTPDQVKRLIPKDILIFNWFWDYSAPGTRPKNHEEELEAMGFKEVFGNMTPAIVNYEVRKARKSVLGGAPSAWFATNEVGFGKELTSWFLGCSNMLWNGHVIPGKALSGRVQSMLPAIRVRLSGTTPPSQTETSIVPVDISSRFNIGDTVPVLGVNLDGMASEAVKYNDIPFALMRTNGMHGIIVGTEGRESTGLPKAVTGIPMGEDPTSLVFLHASAKPALNREGFRLLWDQQDTADLLGWYEVVYEDGFVTTIPIRYGVNILEWNWDERVSGDDYCYGADAVAVGGRTTNRVTFFAYEWTNPRLGKVVQEIRLKGTTGFRGGPAVFNNDYGPVIASNAVILVALSIVQKRN